MLSRPRICVLLLLVLLRPAIAANSPELTAAIDLYHKKDYNAAATALRELQTKTPNDPELLYYLGKTDRKLENFDEGIQVLEKATELDPKNSEYFVALGDVYGGLANKPPRSFAAAQRCCIALETAVTLDPKSEDARAALIDFCRKAPTIVGGGMQKAYNQAKDFRIQNPVPGTRLLVVLYEADKNYDEAFTILFDTLKVHPDDYSLLYTVGRLAAKSGLHTGEGIIDLQKCLELPVPAKFPSHAAAHIRLAQLFIQEGDTASAQKNYEAALAEEPENQDAKNGLVALAAPH